MFLRFGCLEIKPGLKSRPSVVALLSWKGFHVDNVGASRGIV